ncbi:hypothetical protein CALCODRAFT_197761 [Calocera cornea HHB12733]|uniref:Uncharacterized protein n=1 Tax=Calocera cornea HHB12733 TaxID=1353952 RepID=A0A165C5V3_9BASI|nr:hypothetical protein CALCODRAFT_197761 [Calocera cornea HHB12733]
MYATSGSGCLEEYLAWVHCLHCPRPKVPLFGLGTFAHFSAPYRHPSPSPPSYSPCPFHLTSLPLPPRYSPSSPCSSPSPCSAVSPCMPFASSHLHTVLAPFAFSLAAYGRDASCCAADDV